VWAAGTIAAMTDETTDETDATIGAIGAELYGKRWLTAPPDESVQQ